MKNSNEKESLIQYKLSYNKIFSNPYNMLIAFKQYTKIQRLYYKYESYIDFYSAGIHIINWK